jgi:hypothetical protein
MSLSVAFPVPDSVISLAFQHRATTFSIRQETPSDPPPDSSTTPLEARSLRLEETFSIWQGMSLELQQMWLETYCLVVSDSEAPAES